MNVQTHMSAQQDSDHHDGLPRQNGNGLPSNQMQNLIGGVTAGAVRQQSDKFNDAELLRVRGHMRDRIFQVLLQRQPQGIDDTTRMKFRDISKRLEEGLFNAACTKEDYMNLDTLEFRLTSLIKRRSASNPNQKHRPLVNSSASIGTKIPTPDNGSSPSMVASSLDSSTTAASGVYTNVGTPSSGMQSISSDRSDGTLLDKSQKISGQGEA